jgi:hypothetical protein
MAVEVFSVALDARSHVSGLLTMVCISCRFWFCCLETGTGSISWLQLSKLLPQDGDTSPVSKTGRWMTCKKSIMTLKFKFHICSFPREGISAREHYLNGVLGMCS